MTYSPNATNNADKVLDLAIADDHLMLRKAFYNALPLGALPASAFQINNTGFADDAADRIIYEADTGELYYDVNGKASRGI